MIRKLVPLVVIWTMVPVAGALAQVEERAPGETRTDPAPGPDSNTDRKLSGENDPSAPLATDEATLGEIRYRLIGYLRLEGVFVQDDPNQQFVGHSDGFRLQNARVGLQARWRERVTFRFTADGANDERANPNETEGKLVFALKDAYADVHMSKRFDVRIARFRPVFDIERLTSPSRRGFVRRALSSRGVHATEGFEKPGITVLRTLGIAFRSPNLNWVGGPLEVGFEVAVQNGNGSEDAGNDNDALAYSAALFAKLKSWFSVIGAARFNPRTEGELPDQRNEEDIEVALSGRIEAGPFRGTAQALSRRTTFDTTGGLARNAVGFHAEALLSIPRANWIEVGYRFSLLEASDLDPSDRLMEHTAGANINWPGARGRFQLNATHVVEQGGRALDNSRIEAAIQVSL